MNTEIFVFGSNTQGRHLCRAALAAVRQYGAIYGQSRGRQGNAYAICTKDLTKQVHPSVSKEEIISQILSLYEYAVQHPDLLFKVAYTTKPNLNGYTPAEMAEMFICCSVPANINFDPDFRRLMIASYLKGPIRKTRET